MSMCDRCAAPGHCCKGMGFTRRNADGSLQPAGLNMTADEANAEAARMGYDFFVADEVARLKGGHWWRFRCKHLTTEGRCGIYASRPEMCRTYEPMFDGLCVHWNGDAGDASAGEITPINLIDGGVRFPILDSEAA